uniref:Uncharacterized protein n=1 Tax=Arundo donax TaxID=35708 RepID=A0A0A8YCD0_ARUDO
MRPISIKRNAIRM